MSDGSSECPGGVNPGAHNELLVPRGPGNLSNRGSGEINDHVDVVNDSRVDGASVWIPLMFAWPLRFASHQGVHNVPRFNE